MKDRRRPVVVSGGSGIRATRDRIRFELEEVKGELVSVGLLLSGSGQCGRVCRALTRLQERRAKLRAREKELMSRLGELEYLEYKRT